VVFRDLTVKSLDRQPYFDVRSEDMTASIILWLLNFGGAAVIGAVLLYAGQNASGHTGFPPFLLGPPLLVLLLAGGIASSQCRRKSVCIPAALCMVVGLFGLVLPFALHFTCILRQYDDWAQSGMPVSPTWRLPFLIGYFVTFLAAAITVLAISKHKTKAK
jgi:hypothetical protein